MLSNKALAVVVLAASIGLLSSSAAADCNFVSTKDGSPLTIKAVESDTPEAKEFLKTCINPYTKKYDQDPSLAIAGKKKFGYWSCTQCHGGNAGGQTGPSATDATWQYAKHITDKGLFETIAGGSNGGMPTWHAQPSGNPELLNTDEILKMIGWLRTMYAGGGDRPWLKD